MEEPSKKLEERLQELGESLASPPSSVDDLYSLLDITDGHLSRVEQSPSPLMLKALEPLIKALAGNELLRHTDIDIKVAVASCISEITRITAPEAPYDDDAMKEIFQMIVGAFEGLDDMSSRSFQKRVSILETVAKVRSCVVMLDLECDNLILEMFRHFLKNIRTNHSENVFSSMETIMTLVIEESEEISSELLSSLLDALKKDKDVLPIAQKLSEKVMCACGSKLKPHLLEFIEAKHTSFSEYYEVVASICRGKQETLDHNETNASGEVVVDDSKLSERTVSDELPQASAKLDQEVGCPEKAGSNVDASPIVVASNGPTQVGNEDSTEQPSPKHKSERPRRHGQSKNVPSDQADSDHVKPSTVKGDNTTDLKKPKGRNNTSVQLAETADQSHIDSEKDIPAVTSRRKNRVREPDGSQADAVTKKEDAAGSSEPENKNGIQHPSGSDKLVSDVLPAPSENLPNSGRSKRGRPPGSKAKRAEIESAANAPVSASLHKDPPGNSETNDVGIVSKGGESQMEPKGPDGVEVPVSFASDSEAIPKKIAGKRGRPRGRVAGQGSSGRKEKLNKDHKEEVLQEKHDDGEVSLKEVAVSPRLAAETSAPDEARLEESAKPKSRRKRATETEDIPKTVEDSEELDERLVGSKVQVWWPDDEEFYAGVVDSYDPLTKQHKIVYDDGDVEILLLQNELWKYAESGSEDKQKAGEGSSQNPRRSKKAKPSPATIFKQSMAEAPPKSGTEPGSKDTPRPRGRPRGSSNIAKLLTDSSPGSTKRLKDKTASESKSKAPLSSGKLNESRNEPVDETLKARRKREESISNLKDLAKTDASKGSGKKDEASRSGRKSKNETPSALTRSKGAAKDGSSSGIDGGKVRDSMLEAANTPEVTEAGKNKTPRVIKPKSNSIPMAGSDSKENGGDSSKGKMKIRGSGNTAPAPAPASDGEAATGGRRRKRKSRQ